MCCKHRYDSYIEFCRGISFKPDLVARASFVITVYITQRWSCDQGVDLPTSGTPWNWGR